MPSHVLLCRRMCSHVLPLIRARPIGWENKSPSAGRRGAGGNVEGLACVLAAHQEAPSVL